MSSGNQPNQPALIDCGECPTSSGCVYECMKVSKPERIPTEDLNELMDRIKNATPAEDGMEVPEVVAWMWRDINGDMQFNYMHPNGKPLMTVAQHSRIVAAKDAEIAHLRSARDAYGQNAIDLQREVMKLRAQPAQKDEHVRAARLVGR